MNCDDIRYRIHNNGITFFKKGESGSVTSFVNTEGGIRIELGSRGYSKSRLSVIFGLLVLLSVVSVFFSEIVMWFFYVYFYFFLFVGGLFDDNKWKFRSAAHKAINALKNKRPLDPKEVEYESSRVSNSYFNYFISCYFLSLIAVLSSLLFSVPLVPLFLIFLLSVICTPLIMKLSFFKDIFLDIQSIYCVAQVDEIHIRAACDSLHILLKREELIEEAERFIFNET